jgi:uridine kinase
MNRRDGKRDGGKRNQRGPLSPEGYYHDAFDFEAVRRLVLQPLGPGGDGWYRRAIFDHRTDTALELPAERAITDAMARADIVIDSSDGG